jgi:flagellar basal-body rod modification protein FlgD
MTDTTAAGSTPSTTPTPTPTQVQRSTGGILGKDDFLKLMVAQLQHQDPMNPMQDSDMMGQMASFSTLEQITNMAAANQTIASNLTSTGAIGLIGRTVTYTDENDIPHTGVVSKVTTAGGSPSLTVDGVDGIAPATVSQVA